MNRDDVTRWSREAGFTIGPVTDEIYSAPGGIRAELEHFAALVAAAEREACAKVCEEMTLEWEDQPNIAQAELATMMDCALAIRARGERG